MLSSRFIEASEPEICELPTYVFESTLNVFFAFILIFLICIYNGTGSGDDGDVQGGSALPGMH